MTIYKTVTILSVLTIFLVSFSGCTESNVITSYSIHYTKLYEEAMQILTTSDYTDTMKVHQQLLQKQDKLTYTVLMTMPQYLETSKTLQLV